MTCNGLNILIIWPFSDIWDISSNDGCFLGEEEACVDVTPGVGRAVQQGELGWVAGSPPCPSKSSAKLCIHQSKIDAEVQDLNTALRLYHPTISSNCHINRCKKQCTLQSTCTSFLEQTFLIRLNRHFKVHPAAPGQIPE